jgi:hypothetical protein|tara:strand:+ start:1388 stop:3010 length:1623 start_codon:yes stop_codon:yes gene_type:complete
MHAVIFNDNLEIKRRTMGAYKIANCLERRGWRVTVVDWVSAWNEWQLRTYLSDICTDETTLFGVSYTWLEPDYARTLIQGLKEFRPDVKIMLGGQQFIQHDLGADIYMYGYAETALDAVLDYWFADGEKPIGARPIELGGAQLIDCNADYRAMDLGDYSVTYRPDDYVQPQEQLTVELSRGCRFACKYCNYAFLGVKQDTSTAREILRAELMRNWEEWGTTNYIIADDTLNDRDSKLEMLADVVESLPFEPNFASFVRIDLTVSKPHQLELLSRARVWAHFYGVETFDAGAGKAVSKGMSPDKIKQGLLAMRKHMKSKLGLYRGSLGMIAGLPGETPESWRDSEQWLLDNWIDQNWTWWPLEISTEDNLATVSEFSRDWEKNGYTRMDDPERIEAVKDVFVRHSSEDKVQHKYDYKTLYWKHSAADLADAVEFVGWQRKTQEELGWPNKIPNFHVLNYAGQYEWDDILARSDAWNNQQVRYGAEYRRIIEPYITRKLEGVYDIKKELGLDSHFGIKKMKQLSINPHIDANHEESLQLHPM